VGVRIESMAEKINCQSGGCIEYRDGWHSRVKVDAEPADDADYYSLEFVDARGVATDRLIGYGVSESRTSTCETGPPALPPGERVCVRVVAYDLAGNAAGNETPICEEAIHCETLYRDEHCSMLLPQCVPAGCCGVGVGASGSLPLVFIVLLGLRRRSARTP
jgi:hypothetical protein